MPDVIASRVGAASGVRWENVANLLWLGSDLDFFDWTIQAIQKFGNSWWSGGLNQRISSGERKKGFRREGFSGNRRSQRFGVWREAGSQPFGQILYKGKGHAAFATWPFIFMPATTYSPTHFRVQYNRPCGA